MTKTGSSIDAAVDSHIRNIVSTEVSARMASIEARVQRVEANMAEISVRLGSIASNMHVTQQISRDTERAVASLRGHIDQQLEAVSRDIAAALIGAGKQMRDAGQ